MTPEVEGLTPHISLKDFSNTRCKLDRACLAATNGGLRILQTLILVCPKVCLLPGIPASRGQLIRFVKNASVVAVLEGIGGRRGITHGRVKSDWPSRVSTDLSAWQPCGGNAV